MCLRTQSPSCVPPPAGWKRSFMIRFANRSHKERKLPAMLFRGLACALFVVTAGTGYAQTDPGIRSGAPGAGQPFATGLSSGDMAFFNSVALPTFNEVEMVANGLGPRFNLDSCGGCH